MTGCFCSGKAAKMEEWGGEYKTSERPFEKPVNEFSTGCSTIIFVAARQRNSLSSSIGDLRRALSAGDREAKIPMKN